MIEDNVDFDVGGDGDYQLRGWHINISATLLPIKTVTN